jgi:heme exporter protein CcmD
MNSFSEFLNMGGYGFYVWSSWALFLLVTFGNLVYTQTLYRRTLRVTRSFLRKSRNKS